MVQAHDPFVSFKGVQKSYDGESLVVKNLNLDIAAGEFLTMLGPSGSGKTTCLMMLAGFETATHGDIELGGRPINNIPPHKRGIGMVFQNYALFPHMTVGENLAFPLNVRNMPKAEVEEKVRSVLDMVQMMAFIDRKPAQLSGGQQQRIALARALVFSPELVLMDEPLGALDKQLREHMQYEIKHIHENLGVTVVYVTHDQSEALTMSNRIAVFDDGIIQQLADPVTLYEKPENYKIDVLCEPQMGKRKLYPTLSTKIEDKDTIKTMNFLSFCDGKTSLLNIADLLKVPIWELYELAEKLQSHSLISEN